MILKIDCHCHTAASHDSGMKLSNVISTARTRGLDGLVITDHNTVTVTPQLVEKYSDEKFLLIPGEEIDTGQGQLLAMGLRERVRPNKDPFEVIQSVHDQGGIIWLAHPFKRAISYEDRLIEALDAIEGFNARGEWLTAGTLNKQAQGFATESNKPTLGGSDAHLQFEIGNAFSVIEADQLSFAAIRNAIRAGNCRWGGRESTMFAEPLSQLVRAWKQRSLRVAWRATNMGIQAGVYSLRGLIREAIVNGVT